VAKNAKHARKQGNARTVDLGELVAKIADNGLRHCQANGRNGHLASPHLVLAAQYGMHIDNAIVLQSVLQNAVERV
jgi:hypothetical protein